MKEQDLGFIARLLEPLKNRILLLAGRAILAAVKEEDGRRSLQVIAQAGEEIDAVEQYQEFGFASRPPAGSEGVFLALGGTRDHCIVIATEHPGHRPANLEDGEAMVYSSENGGEEGDCHLYLKSGRLVELAGESVTLLLNGTPLAITAAEGLISIIAPGMIRINDTVMPAVGEGGGGGRPAVQNLSADTVNIEADTLTITLGGTTYTYGATNMPARIGLDSAGGDLIQEGS